MNKTELVSALSALGTWIQVFGVLVAIGIVGEVGVGVRSWILNRRLQAIERVEDMEQRTEIARLNREAGDARKDAALAIERASSAEENLAGANERAALAEQHAAEASAKAEGFRLDIAKANERAADANRIAEQERLARLQLEARLADRVLTPDGQSRLTALAATFPHGTRIDIFMFGGTLEIANITQSINKSLAAGGWTVRQWQVTGGGAVRGILVGTNPSADAATARAASGIISTLVSAGVGAGPWKFDELVMSGMAQGPGEPMDAPIRMFIGSKQ
ncbi:MAG: hypothetical protein LAO04_02720 [Acidobacteriia bacterium]|nr:hypothetical protein [Terriglobia bacterium]